MGNRDQPLARLVPVSDELIGVCGKREQFQRMDKLALAGFVSILAPQHKRHGLQRGRTPERIRAEAVPNESEG